MFLRLSATNIRAGHNKLVSVISIFKQQINLRHYPQITSITRAELTTKCLVKNLYIDKVSKAQSTKNFQEK